MYLQKKISIKKLRINIYLNKSIKYWIYFTIPRKKKIPSKYSIPGKFNKVSNSPETSTASGTSIAAPSSIECDSVTSPDSNADSPPFPFAVEGGEDNSKNETKSEKGSSRNYLERKNKKKGLLKRHKTLPPMKIEKSSEQFIISKNNDETKNTNKEDNLDKITHVTESEDFNTVKPKEIRFSIKKKHALIENKTKSNTSAKPKSSSFKWRRSSKKDKSNLLFVPSCTDIKSLCDSDKSLIDRKNSGEISKAGTSKNSSPGGDRNTSTFTRCNSEIRRTSSRKQRFRNFSLRSKRFACDEVSFI